MDHTCRHSYHQCNLCLLPEVLYTNLLGALSEQFSLIERNDQRVAAVFLNDWEIRQLSLDVMDVADPRDMVPIDGPGTPILRGYFWGARLYEADSSVVPPGRCCCLQDGIKGYPVDPVAAAFLRD